MYGTTAVKFEPTMARGQRIGCQLHFSALIKDHAYRKGEPTKVSGSIGVQDLLTSGTFKVVVEDMVLDRRGFDTVPSTPHSAHLRSSTGATSVASERSRAPSNTPGGLFILYRFDGPFSAILAQLSTSDTLTVVFNRRQGGPDVAVDVDFTVVGVEAAGVRKQSRQAVSDFLSCKEAVLK
jgi:hypothetical protein